MKLFKSSAIAFACALCLACGLLTGCAQQTSNSAEAEDQAANRAYMSEVNQSMETLESRLASFTEAVSRQDIVTMRSQADNAYKALDDLAAIEAPSKFSDVQNSYVSGTNDLKTALNDYITLYSDIENATDESPFDWTSYESRLTGIQDQYNKGVEELQNADNTLSGFDK